jgi:ubiquinone/menaquinone biosynthesis C-methylase UbiE
MRVATALLVHPTNAEQARAWDGDEGAFWAANAEAFDRAVAGYHDKLLGAGAIERGDRVLDIGCGTGQVSRDAARAARDGEALGVDLSGEMIAVAHRMAAEQGVANVRFQRCDVQIHPFQAASFDVAISRTGTMFFGDPAAAFANIGRALRPGGRLALLVWQGPEANEWIRELIGALAVGRNLPVPPAGAPGPFAQADPRSAAAVLTDAGFAHVEHEELQEPMWFGSDAAEAHRFVLGQLGWMLSDLDDGRRDQALDNLRGTIAAHDTGDGVWYQSATWLIRATRP